MLQTNCFGVSTLIPSDAIIIAIWKTLIHWYCRFSAQTILTMMPHRFSVRFWSRKEAGHCSTVMLFWFRKSMVALLLWTAAIFRWKMKWISSFSSRKGKRLHFRTRIHSWLTIRQEGKARERVPGEQNAPHTTKLPSPKWFFEKKFGSWRKSPYYEWDPSALSRLNFFTSEM